jgi:hypothetical protein
MEPIVQDFVKRKGNNKIVRLVRQLRLLAKEDDTDEKVMNVRLLSLLLLLESHFKNKKL